MNQKSIAIIMPSYLGEYLGCASDRDNKFLRAVNSLNEQTYPDKHIIIVSDGCEKTYSLYKMFYKEQFKNIHCIQITKQEIWSGSVRQAGIQLAIKKIQPDIITYCDSDDYLLPDHLERIINQFGSNDWVYFNDTLNKGNNYFEKRNVILEKNHIGTSNIAHKAIKAFNWKDCNGYGHDWTMIKTKLMPNTNYQKIDCSSYIVCHNPVMFDN